MQQFRFFISLFFLLSALNAKADRAMYVDGFGSILGNVLAENTLLSYAQSHGIQTLLLYELHIVNANYNLPNPTTNFVLADFIRKAKTTYGIVNVGATSENAFYFTNVIDTYNNSRTDPLEKFDIYNLEFEYWIGTATGPGGYYCTNYLIPNGLPCSEQGAFQLYVSILQTMRTLANNNAHPITTEAYVGWPTAGQADTIGANLDRLRLHAYVNDPNTAFNYSDGRLIDFANGNPGLDVSIIFSTEPVFMQNWLLNNSMTAAEYIYTADWANGSSGWANNINLEGFTYYNYTDMVNVTLPIELSYFEGNAMDDGVHLNWGTLSETNFDHFELERQNSLTHQFHSLGNIEAMGNSSSATRYQFVDPSPNIGVNHYRLKQVDHDSRFRYSKVIAVAYLDGHRATKVYPSIAQDQIYIEPAEKIDQVFLYNTNGRKLKEISNIAPSLTTIDLTDLTAGVYFLSLKSGSEFESFRFVKQN